MNISKERVPLKYLTNKRPMFLLLFLIWQSR